jgi:O-antigen/teichoic acid export membrane protein
MRLVALEVDKADFGVYLLTVSVIAYIGLSQMGLDLAASQRIAEALARGDEKVANRIYHQLTRYNTGICFAVGLVVAGAISYILYVSGYEKPQLIAWIIFFVGFSGMVQCFSVPATATLSGSQNMHLIGVLNQSTSLCTTILGYILLRSGWGILCLPAAQAVMTPISLCVLHVLRMRNCPWSRQPVEEIWNGFGKLFRYATGVAIAVAIGMLDSSSDPIIFKLGSNEPLVDTATFNIWNRFPAMTLIFSSALLTNSGPTLAAKMEKARSEGLAFHRSILWLSTAIGSSATIGLCIWLVPFMHHWLDGTYDVASGKYIAIALATAIGFRALMVALIYLLYPLNRIEFVVKSYAVLVVLKVIFGIALVQVSPVAGMAWANAIAAMGATIYVGATLRRVAEYNLRTLIGTFGLVIIAALIGSTLGGSTAGASMTMMIIGILVTMAILGILCLGLVHRLQIISLKKFLPASLQH